MLDKPSVNNKLEVTIKKVPKSWLHCKRALTHGWPVPNQFIILVSSFFKSAHDLCLTEPNYFQGCVEFTACLVLVWCMVV